MKQLNHILNIIMGSCIGVFIGNGIYVYHDYHTHPSLYALHSAPWYASILTYGIFTLIVLAVCSVIKIIIYKRKFKQ